MKKYRLKKEAVPFFKESLANDIYDWETWQSLQVDDKALEEVGDPFIKYGHWYKLESGTPAGVTSGWDKEGSHFHFTIHFPSVKFGQHDKFSNGRVVRGLMDRIQSIIDNHYRDFNNSEEQNL